jgi:chromosome segregation ATPase
MTLKKENLSKGQELENLKVSLSYLKEKQGFNDSSTKNIKEGLNKSIHTIGNENINTNKIIENYKKENEEIKKNNNIYQDKIKFYQQQIRTIKNELYEKDQAIIEMENNNENKIREMKDSYEKKILEVNSKNKVLEKNFEESQNSNCDLNQEICNLKEQINAKDAKIFKLNYQIEQLQKQLEELKKQINKDKQNNNNNNSNEYYKNFRHEFGIFSKEKQFNSILNKSNYKYLNKPINNNYLNNSNKNYNKIYQNENFLTRNLLKFQIFKNSKNF